MDGGGVSGRRVIVVGAARSGIAAATWCAVQGARVVLADRREAIDERAALEAAGVEVVLGPHRDETFADADLVVVSPGVPPELPVLETARRAGAEVIGEFEFATRRLRGRIVAITGTKGKSTTTTLVGRMFEEGGFRTRVGGNIGVPLSAQIDDSTPDTIHVIEASSFQLEMAPTFHPAIAVFLNFSPDHLDRHGTEAAYGAAKAQIVARQVDSDVAVLNADDPAVARLVGHTRARREWFTVAEPSVQGAGIVDGAIVHRGAEGSSTRLAPVSSIRLIGPHLVADVVAAACTAHVGGVAPAAIELAIAGFGGLEHALELVATIEGVRFVNDSKATNVEAARRSIESFEGGVVAIVGGRFKGGDLGGLRGPLAARGTAVVAIGEAAGLVRTALGTTVPVHDAPTLDAAVDLAWRLVPPGGVVVLAPACASHDMFRDYAERGRVFTDAVRRLEASRVRGER